MLISKLVFHISYILITILKFGSWGEICKKQASSDILDLTSKMVINKKVHITQTYTCNVIHSSWRNYVKQGIYMFFSARHCARNVNNKLCTPRISYQNNKMAISKIHNISQQLPFEILYWRNLLLIYKWHAI